MRYVKWFVIGFVTLFVLAFLHYALPRHDIVRINNTFSQRIEVGENSWFWSQNDQGMAVGAAVRDVKFIETAFPNGRVMVYRNEDTGWGWPPYFKFDSFDVQARAADLKSTAEAPKWAVITRYGWRNQYFTIFPNAVKIKAVSGPDVTIIPWFNIIFFILLALLLVFLRRIWLQFRERTLDPAVNTVSDSLDAAAGQAQIAGKRAKGWLSTWRKPPRP